MILKSNNFKILLPFNLIQFIHFITIDFRPKMSANVVVNNDPKINATASKIDAIYGVNSGESAILKIITA